MDQELALDIMLSGENVLLSGPPGSGKTYVLNQFIKRARGIGKHVAVTATTGLAATHLNGSTIHSWSGMGVQDKLPRNFQNHLPQSRKDTIKKADVLIIDEISMLHDYQLDMVDEILRKILNNNEPFGSLQIIICGDFFQLPPISRSGESPANFVIHSNVWEQLDPVVCYLSEQHRQNDDAYLEILNAIRSSDLRRRHLDSLLSRKGSESASNILTELHTTRADVETINTSHLNNLKGKTRSFTAETKGSASYAKTLKRSCLASDYLQLKKGALVMCIRNDPKKGFVNGSLGVVTGFDRGTGYPKVELKSGRQVVVSPATWELRDGDRLRASLTQVPLQLAWAITIHKSQGMTLDGACIDLRRAFVPGMGYVALSRLRNINSLKLIGINNMALRVSEEALLIDEQLRRQSSKDAQRLEKLRGKFTEDKSPSTPSWSDKINKMREKYPNAYKPWTKIDDLKLVSMFVKDDEVSISKLAGVFGRHPGSIRARIKKHLES